MSELQPENFLEVVIKFNNIVDRHLYDIGAVILQNSTRSYIMDVTESYTSTDTGVTVITCKLEKDEEIYDKGFTKYDLTTNDLFEDTLSATIFIGGEYEEKPESMTLFVKINDLTKAINLVEE